MKDYKCYARKSVKSLTNCNDLARTICHITDLENGNVGVGFKRYILTDKIELYPDYLIVRRYKGKYLLMEVMHFRIETLKALLSGLDKKVEEILLYLKTNENN
jgi:hypothetical protein